MSCSSGCRQRETRMTPKLLSYSGDDWYLLCMSDNPRRMIVIDCEFSDFYYYADGLSLLLNDEYEYEIKQSGEFPAVAEDQSYATVWNGTKLYPVETIPKLFEEDHKFLNLALTLEDMQAYPIRKSLYD